MAKIYCLPGLGTDHRVFQKLIPLLSFEEVVYLDFRDDLLLPGELIADYAKRLAEELRHRIEQEEEAPYILGLSLGGFVAVELAKQIPHQKLILISTIKHQSEAPFFFPIARRLPIYKIIPAWFSRHIVPIISRITGVTDKEGYRLYKQMLKGWSVHRLRWARHAAVHWTNAEMPSNFLHIHGTNDHIFNHRRLTQTDYLLDAGSHNMIMDRAEEIASIIRKELQTD